MIRYFIGANCTNIHQENIPIPLHHHRQDPEPLIQCRIEPYFYVLAKFSSGKVSFSKLHLSYFCNLLPNELELEGNKKNDFKI